MPLQTGQQVGQIELTGNREDCPPALIIAIVSDGRGGPSMRQSISAAVVARIWAGVLQRAGTMGGLGAPHAHSIDESTQHA
jgi:hypothetical protein